MPKSWNNNKLEQLSIHSFMVSNNITETNIPKDTIEFLNIRDFKIKTIDDNLAYVKGDLNLIATIDTIDQGSYNLNGKLISNLKEKELANIRNLEIGFIYQNFALIDELSGLDNIIVPLKVRKLKKSHCKQIALDALKQVGLEGLEKKRVYELSGGQRQRVAIARTIAQNTNIILADEPTGNLDKNTGKEIMNILLELNKKGKTIILVTHDLELAKITHNQITIADREISKLNKSDLLS